MHLSFWIVEPRKKKKYMKMQTVLHLHAEESVPDKQFCKVFLLYVSFNYYLTYFCFSNLMNILDFKHW
jgi:hypothetical protein